MKMNSCSLPVYVATLMRNYPALRQMRYKRLWRYFSTTYEQARARLRHAAKRYGFSWRSIPVEDKYDTDLSIDVFIRKGAPDSTKPCLLHICGTRGVDGFAGSAIQLFAVRHHRDLFPPDMPLIFVHALNPYGMKYGRLVNVHNVDLEHNGLHERDFNQRLTQRLAFNPIYAQADSLLNPCALSHPSRAVSSWTLKRQEMQLRWRGHVQKQPLYRAVMDVGQHWRADGLAFGGFQMQPELRALLRLELPARVCVVVASVDAGDNSQQQHPILRVPEENMADVLQATQQYPYVEPLHNLDAVCSAVQRQHSRQHPEHRVLAVQQCFPAKQVDSISILNAIRAENIMYHHNLNARCMRNEHASDSLSIAADVTLTSPPPLSEWAERVERATLTSSHLNPRNHRNDHYYTCLAQEREHALHPFFRPSDEFWQENVILRGITLLLQLMED